MRLDYGILRAPARILFGNGQRAALGRVAAELGQRVLVCTDARFAATPQMQAIRDDLERQGLAVAVFDGTQPELPLSGIVNCATRFRDFDPQVVVGLGGGSCLDLAKLAALLLTHGGQLPDYYGEMKVPGPVLPVIAVPTTSGTGSEATPVAVLGDPSRAIKVGISSPHLIPHTAICDPELTLTCPAGLTAISGADALAHAVECFAAVERPGDPAMALTRVFVGKNALGDHLALSAIRLLFDHLPRAVEDGGDLEARSAVMLGATMAGLAFGSGGTAAAHALQYPVGAETGSAHGLGIAILLPHTIDFNLVQAPGAYADLARALGLSDAADDMAAARAFAAALRDLFARIGIPAGLDALNVDPAGFGRMAELAMGATRLVENNPRPLDAAAMRGILDMAMPEPRGKAAHA
ncbi:iron-containing alcohol dehydrogenase [Paracoccus sp. (in: a-proteobacteria)]|uniref:iron-containing alcohol dehydrogenase n=1 Tax=Paracoccus sp. TaxID=267 RepID=UPI0035B071AF